MQFNPRKSAGGLVHQVTPTVDRYTRARAEAEFNMRLVGTVGNSWISASPEKPWEPLQNALRRFRVCSIGLSVGLAGASVKVGIYGFVYESEGSRYWLSLPDLIKAMRFEAKKASNKGTFKWLNNILSAQERFLSSL